MHKSSSGPELPSSAVGCSSSGSELPSSAGYSASGITAPTVAWLQSVLLPKIAQWAEESATKGSQNLREPLVPLDRYYKLYQDLKEKYGTSLIKVVAHGPYLTILF